MLRQLWSHSQACIKYWAPELASHSFKLNRSQGNVLYGHVRFHQCSIHYLSPASCLLDYHKSKHSKNPFCIHKSKYSIYTNNNLFIRNSCWPKYYDCFHISHIRLINTTQSRSLRKDSNVEQVTKVIKDKIDDKKDPVPVESTSTPSVVKPSLWHRGVDVLKHYYHGFRLLFIDIRVAFRILWSLRDGRTLTRRERRQLVRTTADIFRLVPFLVFIIVPFMEFLLPFALKFFPGMLPSTFESENKKQEKLKKTLKGKLEMAKFLQDTIEQSALQHKHGAKEVNMAQDFSTFLTKIRTSGELTTVEDILKYSKLFEDEITLDNMSRDQLRALCRVLEIQPVGPDYLMRFHLRMQLRYLKADDKIIQKEGVDGMTTWELQSACKARGMRALGQSEERLRSQLQQWIDLHLHEQIPSSLLLLSRAMYISENIPTTDQLQATMSALSEATASEAKLKAAELSGDKVDNLAKLERIKEEEKAIKKEKEEILSDEELAKAMEKKLQEETEQLVVDEKDEAIVEKAPDIGAKEKLEDDKITQKELEDIEAAIEDLAKQKEKDMAAELDELKEDVSEYREDVEELKEVVVASGGNEQDIRESKAAKNLSKQMSRLIGEMDGFIDQLLKEKKSIQEEIEVKEVRIKHSEEPNKRDIMITEVDTRKGDIVGINELLMSLKRLQKVPDDTRIQTILDVLDEDHDGVLDVNTVLKVIEILGEENVKLTKEQISNVINLIKRESALEVEELKDKQEMDLENNVEGGEDGKTIKKEEAQ